MARRLFHAATIAVALACAFGGPAAAQERLPGGWRMLESLPGIRSPPCVARTEGPQLNTNLLLNRDGVPVLTLGRADWHDLSGEVVIGYSIDGRPAERHGASMAVNLVVTTLDSPALVAEFRAAGAVDWGLPFGQFRSDLTGFGAALQAVQHCVAKRDGPQVRLLGGPT